MASFVCSRPSHCSLHRRVEAHISTASTGKMTAYVYDAEAALQTYLNWTESFRQGNYDEARAREHWGEKTEDERKQIDGALNRLWLETNEYDRRLAAHYQEIEETLEEARKRIHDFGRLRRDRHEVALQRMRHIVTLSATITDLWLEVSEVETAQIESGHQANIDYATQEYRGWSDATQERRDEEVEIARFVQEWWPPKNNLGRRRAPRSWVGAREARDDRAAVRRAEAAQHQGELGLAEPREGHTWVAWRESGGGLSKGCIWVCFNEDGYVVDVSPNPGPTCTLQRRLTQRVVASLS